MWLVLNGWQKMGKKKRCSLEWIYKGAFDQTVLGSRQTAAHVWL